MTVSGNIPYVIIVLQIFWVLINPAYDFEIRVSPDIFIDGFQFICPAKHPGKNGEHYWAGMDVIVSLWTMRSLGVRFVVVFQSWSEINVASRDTFD